MFFSFMESTYIIKLFIITNMFKIFKVNQLNIKEFDSQKIKIDLNCDTYKYLIKTIIN